VSKNIGQRVIGAIILLGLAIIFLPIVLDPQRGEQIVVDRQLDAPELQRFVIENPKRVANAGRVGSYQQQIEPLNEVANAQPPKPKSKNEVVPTVETKMAAEQQRRQPVLDDNGLPVAWSVQVASFGSEKNARAIEKTLKSSGYLVYVKEAVLQQSPVWRVFLGPMVNKSDAQVINSKLAKTHQITGLIVRFVP
jgi:DedD protein